MKRWRKADETLAKAAGKSYLSALRQKIRLCGHSAGDRISNQSRWGEQEAPVHSASKEKAGVQIGINIKRAVFAASALVLGFACFATQAASASVQPMTFDECGTNGGSQVYNCMYISGGGLSATEVRGWSTDYAYLADAEPGMSVHEQVTGPNGTICNSSSVVPTSNSEVVGCQLAPGGSFPIAAGTYCAIVWLWYTYHTSGEYEPIAENCGTASA